MSENQIKQIMKALEEQNKITAEQNKALAAIRIEQGEAKKKIESMEAKLEPINEMFENVTGFNRIAVWIVKLLLGLGALIGALATILYAIRSLILKE